jgi:hypothetical protein
MKLRSQAATAPAIAPFGTATAQNTPALTTIQWLVCAVAGLGFAFDLYESLMNALIVAPVLSSLGGLQSGTRQFNLWVGMFFFIPTVAGGLFGLLGGLLTDLFGRRRVLVWSILLYGFSACAAAFANSLPALLLLRCTTLIGVCVEAVAAIAWLAELFPIPQQRESVLAYTQLCYPLGGLAVSGAYYFCVTYADRFPSIYGGHDAWRYTLLSGLLPAIPLMLVRPFLPESPLWQKRKSGPLPRRPSLRELWRPHMRGATLLATVMLACTFAVPYGALQHTSRIVPGLLAERPLTPRQVQQTVSTVYVIQELGSIAGRIVFALLVVRIVARRRLLRVFLVPALAVYCWLFFFAGRDGLPMFAVAVFCAQALFNGMHSFWGNYLPRIFPTSLRGTGESFAMNIGGRVLGVSAAVLTTQLSNIVPGYYVATRLAYSAGSTALLALAIALIASFLLQEPQSADLPV